VLANLGRAAAGPILGSAEKIGTKLVRIRVRTSDLSHEKTPPERGFFA
jgi:hypothetical protein